MKVTVPLLVLLLAGCSPAQPVGDGGTADADAGPGADGGNGTITDAGAQLLTAPVSTGAVVTTSEFRVQLTVGAPISVVKLQSTNYTVSLGIGLASAPR